jgi:hypothetical protein
MAVDLVSIESGDKCHVVLVGNSYIGKTERAGILEETSFQRDIYHDLMQMPHNIYLDVSIQFASFE